MIAGVDPALLADAAIQTGYYAPDKDLPARALDGKRGPLAWDQNVPSKKGKSWVFRQVWHPDRRALVDIEFSCQRWDDHLPLKTAPAWRTRPSWTGATWSAARSSTAC